MPGCKLCPYTQCHADMTLQQLESLISFNVLSLSPDVVVEAGTPATKVV